jgi:hypothetical protein
MNFEVLRQESSLRVTHAVEDWMPLGLSTDEKGDQKQGKSGFVVHTCSQQLHGVKGSPIFVVFVFRAIIRV